jgi:enoyl-CoA hydratase/carnithine racemase
LPHGLEAIGVLLHARGDGEPGRDRVDEDPVAAKLARQCLGLDVALACDFIVAAPEAQFAASFVKRGLIPDGGGLYFLPRRIGLQLTKELIYSGRTVGAEEALRIHLADRLAEPGNLLAAAHAFAAQFTENSRPAIALMKSIVSRTFETPFELIAAQGRGAQAICYTTDEHRASVEQFLKPKP